MASFNAFQLFLDQTRGKISKNSKPNKKDVVQKENTLDDEIVEEPENTAENTEQKPQKANVNKIQKEEPKEKKIINLREWTTTDIELSKDELETLGNMCLQKIGSSRCYVINISRKRKSFVID